MATQIPDELKAGLPQTKWGKVLGMTPVVMTVVATLLAGLSNGEMTRAQYTRALAAQQQSKAGDQWGFFQAKRLRSAIQLGTLDVMQLTDSSHQLNADRLKTFAATLPEPESVQQALALLLAGHLPEAVAVAKPAPTVQAALDGIEQGLPEPELTRRLNAAKSDLVAGAIRAAQENARDFDDRLRPVVTGGDRLGDAIDAAGRKDLSRDFAELRLRYSALRYDAEAALNRAVAGLYEVQVRQSNLIAERHQRRSQQFFYGLLGAQAAVIIATFALAAQRRSILWSLAAAAGLGAVTFAGYVYMFL